MTVRKSSVLQRAPFKLTRKSSGRCAIFLHLSELKGKFLSVPSARG